MKAILELTPRLNTSWPVFPFMHDCIYLIFTPGAKSRCSPTSYGPGAPPLSSQGPYDIMLLPASTLGSLSSHSCMTASTSFSFLLKIHALPRLAYEVMVPDIFFIPLYLGHQTKWLESRSYFNMKAVFELTPRLNTSGPVFPFKRHCIHLIFTLLHNLVLISITAVQPAVTSYGPGAPA
ncbi:hypothetical protein BU17DRAFT_72376 [Hysterangium stoloniferum]|nr:hypothetical protein BU17DRAFT_72376 [Hysterangium stoloniferum]